MQRTSLEKCLQDAIQSKDISEAMDLIDFIVKSKNGSTLKSIGSTGESFLHQALEVGCKEIAETLLLLQQDDEEIIFRSNSYGINCLILAAKQNYLDILGILTRKSKDVAANSPGYKFWLTLDSCGQSPLHWAAANNPHIDTFQLLITEINKEPNAASYINLTNKYKRNTALHLVTNSTLCDSEVVGLLIKSGADLTIKNQNGHTPYTCLFNQNLQKQAPIFDQLDIAQQKDYLFYYRQYLLEHPKNTRARARYIKFSATQSLTSYLIAKHEFDESIETRNYFLQPKKDGKIVTQMEVPIPYFVLDKMPMYRNKLFAQYSRDALIEIDNDQNEQDKNTESRMALASLRLASEDEYTLENLIKNIEDYVADLQTRPTWSLSQIVLSVLLEAVILAAYIGIVTWLAISENEKCPPPNERGHKLVCDWDQAALTFGVLGSLLVISVGAALTFLNFIRPAQISRNEYKDILDSLNENVLEKLESLQAKENADRAAPPHEKIDYLPVSSKTIIDLKANLNKFNDNSDQYCFDKSIGGTESALQTINKFNPVKEALKEIKTGLNVTKKPFSLFYKQPHQILNIDDATQLKNDEKYSSTELTALMR